MSTPADELRTAVAALRTARFAGAMTATPTAAALIRARLPLADWLDEELAQLENDDFPAIHERALAVARQINAQP